MTSEYYTLVGVRRNCMLIPGLMGIMHSYVINSPNLQYKKGVLTSKENLLLTSGLVGVMSYEKTYLLNFVNLFLERQPKTNSS